VETLQVLTLATLLSNPVLQQN